MCDVNGFGIALLLFLCCFTYVSANQNAMEVKSGGCNKGPGYWCKTSENARRCNAINICRRSLEARAKRSDIGFLPVRRSTAKPVLLTIYYEAICEECKRLITQVIYPAYQKLASSKIFNVEFVPYGNAQEYQQNGTWVFVCQHGPEECLGNTIEACAVHVIKVPRKYIPFIACVEEHGATEENAELCARKSNFSYKIIEACVNEPSGLELMHEMAVKTKSLNPPHQVVPWITINGVHTNEMQQSLTTDMVGYICQVYTGPTPDVCK